MENCIRGDKKRWENIKRPLPKRRGHVCIIHFTLLIYQALMLVGISTVLKKACCRGIVGPNPSTSLDKKITNIQLLNPFCINFIVLSIVLLNTFLLLLKQICGVAKICVFLGYNIK